MELKVECEAAVTVSLSELSELHHFKTTSDQQYAHLRNSLTEFGFSFPFQIWIDSTGKKWIMDGHRRKPTLERMQSEGWLIPPLPASIIHAPDKKTAKKKLLAMESKYGSFDESGFADFINEDDSSLLDVDLSTYVEIDGLDLDDDGEKGSGSHESRELECPSCHFKFTN